MASILEGIYHHHKVPFQFVKVLANLLEEEGLIRDAYIEELKITARRFTKGIQDSINMAPLLRMYLEERGQSSRRDGNNSILAGTILASALFIGSAWILPHNSYLAYGGFVAAVVAIGIALKKKS
jgi:hypothetical protein